MKVRIWIALIAVYIVWGSTYLAIRFMVETMPPFLSAGVRFLLSGLILFAWRRAAGDARPSGGEWKAAAIIGLLLLLGGNGALVWAEQRIPSGIASLFIGATPLFLVLIDALLPGGRRVGWLTWAGVLVGFGGIALLVRPMETGQSALDPLGVAALLGAAFFWSIGSLYSRGAPLPKSPLLGTGMEMLAGSLGLFAMGTLTGEWGQLELASISLRSVLGLAYLITFGSLIGFVSYTWLLRNAPTPLVATYAYVNPVVAIFLGAVLGEESISPRVIISAAIIIGSVVLINLARTPRARLAAESSGEG
ncbi:MAG: EamA family transporter [Anaerolineales bacterium]|nr:EamA family transporter [Anaerolineales bacterium]